MASNSSKDTSRVGLLLATVAIAAALLALFHDSLLPGQVLFANDAPLGRLAAQAGDRFLGGVVLYDGIHSLPMGSVAGRPIWALPLASLWLSPRLP